MAGDEQRVGRLTPVIGDLPQRATVQVAVVDEQRPGLAAEFRLGVRRIADDEHFPAFAAQHDGLVARRVTRRRDEAHRPIAEHVEGSGETGERLDRLGFVVDGAPVEGVIELAVVVALPEAARVGGRPFTAIDEKRGAGEFGDRARVVDMEMGHDHHPDLGELDSAGRQLRAERLVVLHPGDVDELGGAPHVAAHVGGAARVQAGVDHERAGTRVLDEERRDRKPLPAAPRAEELGCDPGQRERPSGRLVKAPGARSSAVRIGETRTVAPGRPPTSGSCAGFGSVASGIASRTLYRLRAMAILRDNLLAGRTVTTNAAGELRDALAVLGAEVADPGAAEGADAGAAEGADAGAAEGADAGGPVDALVHDARADFGGGGAGALLGALETMWETIASAANASMIASGRGGKVVLIAPEDGAGDHADAARAAIENLARTLSTEWARYRITTTALTPRAGTRESDLAMLVAFVVSEAGDYYSGARFDLGPR